MRRGARAMIGTALFRGDKPRARLLACLGALGMLGACDSRNGDDVVAQTPDTRNPSVARQWNEVMLQAIRKDLARPTVHARNLFHVSAAMYDAWAVYSDTADPYLAGKTLHGYTCALTGFSFRGDRQPAREEAISYAAYRLLRHRFAASPGA